MTGALGDSRFVSKCFEGFDRMDEQIQRGLGWKIAFKRSHADEMDLFREYIGIVHEALERVHASHLDRVARQLSEEPDEQRRQYIEMYYACEGSKLGSTFPAKSNAATFVSILSYLEHEMFSLCARLQKNKKHVLGVKDLSGSGIEQAANYLEKVCEVREFRKDQVWGDVVKLQKLRNIVAHRSGILRDHQGKNDPDKEIRTYALAKGLLADSSAVELVLTKSFCFEAIETVQGILWILIDRVPTADIAGEKP